MIVARSKGCAFSRSGKRRNTGETRGAVEVVNEDNPTLHPAGVLRPAKQSLAVAFPCLFPYPVISITPRQCYQARP